MENLEIIFEDSEILVINKPAGVAVNKSNTYSDVTIQDLLVERESGEKSAEVDDDSDFSDRNGVVHRLDKDTSGVLVVAKTLQAFSELQRQFKGREVKKEYRAVVVGKAPSSKFEVTAPIGRNPENRLIMAVVEGGRESRTLFELQKEIEPDGNKFSFLKAFPATGRTHQIRVHLGSLDIPIVADPIYCTKKQFELSTIYFPRMMLHAFSLEFAHPATGKVLHFEAKLPQEFTKYI